MTEKIASDRFCSDERRNGKNSKNCGVVEGQFPCLGKCCRKRQSLAGTTYEKSCVYCNIWSSLPDSDNLAITYIIGCSLYCYDTRIKE